MVDTNDYDRLPPELRRRVAAALGEHEAMARLLASRVFDAGSSEGRRAILEQLDEFIAERARALEQLDAAATADIEASYAAMPVSLAAYAQAGGAAEALFSLRQRLTQPERRGPDE